jgi:hypothetical protein
MIPWYAVVVIAVAAWLVGIGFGIASRDWRPGESYLREPDLND